MRARVVVLLVASACASSSPAPHVTLAPAASHAPAAASGSLLSPRQPRAIAWQWTGEQPGFGRSFYKSPRTVSDGALECTFTYDDTASAAITSCASGKRELWHHDEPHAFVEDAALALDHGTLYSARFSNISTGCTLYAFDATTGTLRFRTHLVGAGEVAHSEYLNAVELHIIDTRPVVFGWESAARYVEAVDPVSGVGVYHAIVP